MKIMRSFFITMMAVCLSACGFHLQAQTAFSPHLQHLYVQASDPYSVLVKSLNTNLSLSHIQLAKNSDEANIILHILSEENSQQLLGMSGTQQTRQYLLRTTVSFELLSAKGQVLLAPESMTETRTLTMQSNQILASSNEANLLYQQMRRALATSMMYRLASVDVTHVLAKEMR